MTQDPQPDDKSQDKPIKPVKSRGRKRKSLNNDESLSTLLRLVSGVKFNDFEKVKQHKMINDLGKMLTEYFSGYILLSYTIDGEPAIMTYAPTPKEYNSLNVLLYQYIHSHNLRPHRDDL